MHQDNLTQNLNVRISTALRGELALTAACEDLTVGELVRRAIQNEIRSPVVRAMDPYAELPSGEVLRHLHEAVDSLQGEDAVRDVIHAIGDDLVDVLDAGFLTLDTLHDEGAHLRLARAAGYLQQLSLSTLRAASRIRALRALSNYSDYPSHRAEVAESLSAGMLPDGRSGELHGALRSAGSEGDAGGVV